MTAKSVWLKTPLTIFYPDLCDVVRLFWGDVSISPDEGETVITQECAEGGAHFFDLWSCGEEHRRSVKMQQLRS